MATIEHSESLAGLGAALAKASAELGNVLKDAKNPHFRSDYATLAAITDTVRPVLAKHGVSVVQAPGFADGVVTVATMFVHESGEWLRSVAGAPAPKQDPQGVGSAVTYLRRYSLAAFCGIAQADDDGNAASPPRQQQASRNGGGKATTKQMDYLRNLIGSSVFTEAERNRVLAVLDEGDRERVSAAIEWAKECVDVRKKEVEA